MDLGYGSTDGQIRAAVAEKLSEPRAQLEHYVIDRNKQTGDLTVRPQAVFG